MNQQQRKYFCNRVKGISNSLVKKMRKEHAPIRPDWPDRASSYRLKKILDAINNGTAIACNIENEDEVIYSVRLCDWIVLPEEKSKLKEYKLYLKKKAIFEKEMVKLEEKIHAEADRIIDVGMLGDETAMFEALASFIEYTPCAR